MYSVQAYSHFTRMVCLFVSLFWGGGARERRRGEEEGVEVELHCVCSSTTRFSRTGFGHHCVPRTPGRFLIFLVLCMSTALVL